MRSMVVEARARPVVDCSEDPGRTKQSHKDECDINNIIARFTRTGQLEHVNRNAGLFVDVSNVGDFRTSVERVARASEFFMGLPSKVRSEFNNDPAEFLDALADPGARELLESLGLVRLVEPVESGGGSPGPESGAEGALEVAEGDSSE